jgi:hypothetical protein
MVAQKFHLLNGGKLVVLAIFTGVVLTGVLAVRALQTNRIDRQVCTKIDRLDNALIAIVQGAVVVPKPGDYGYTYYRTHPREAASLRAGKPTAAQLATLRAAACDPSNIDGP